MSDAHAEATARARAMRGPLDERMAVLREVCRVLTPDYDAAVDRFAARLRAAGAGAGAPAPGEPFPDFALPDQDGRIVTLGALLETGPAVIAVHRGAWCDFCQLGLRALAEAEPRIRAQGGRLVAVAPQRAAWAARHRAEAGAGFPMLADIGFGLATALGLTAPIDADLAARLAAFDIDLADVNAGDAGLLPIPATFVVAPGGATVARWIALDPRSRVDPDVVVAALAGHAAPSTGRPS